MDFKKGDLVQIKTKNSPWAGTMKVTRYKFIDYFGGTLVECGHPSMGIGSFFEHELDLVPVYTDLLTDLLDAVPAIAAPAPHSCQDNRKTYDSGWSRYDYCYICDRKFE